MLKNLLRTGLMHVVDASHGAIQSPSGDTDTLDLYRWLVSSAAAAWLRELGERHEPLVTATTRLRKTLSAAETHLVLEQVSLRRKAVEKFARGGEMFFTPLGYEQATDEIVAGYKAKRFPAGAMLADLCCGVGGDLLSMAARGTTIGVDRDPVKLLLAEANGRVARCSDALRCRLSDVESFDVGEVAAWHLDPDRRPQGQRTTRVEDHEPNAETIERLISINPHAAIKLAPAAVLPERWSAEAELEWISRGGECRQLVAWFGDLARPAGTVRATRLTPATGAVDSFCGSPQVRPEIAPQVGRFVYEPDAAVLAAHLEGALAVEHGLTAANAGIAYLTGDVTIQEPLLACFEVQAVMPFQAKRLRALLRSRGIGRLEVKKRGVPYDPAELQRQLRVPGDEAATLIVTRLRDAVTAIVAQRVVA